MQMHSGLYDDFVRIDTVEKGIGKAMDKAATNVVADHRPAFRILSDVSNSRVNFIQEVVTETRGLEFIVPSSIKHL